MHAKRNSEKKRKKKDGGKVMSYYSFQILLLPKDVGRQNLNVVLVAMQ